MVTTCGIITLLSVSGLYAYPSFDDGKEFAKHEQVVDTIECEAYFSKP